MNLQEQFEQMRKDGRRQGFIYLRKDKLGRNDIVGLSLLPHVPIPTGLFEKVCYSRRSGTLTYKIVLTPSALNEQFKSKKGLHFTYATVKQPSGETEFFHTEEQLKLKMSELEHIKNSFLDSAIQMNRHHLNQIHRRYWAGVELPIGFYLSLTRDCRKNYRIIRMSMSINGKSLKHPEANPRTRSLGLIEMTGKPVDSISVIHDKPQFIQAIQDLLKMRRDKNPDLHPKMYTFKVDDKVITV